MTDSPTVLKYVYWTGGGLYCCHNDLAGFDFIVRIYPGIDYKDRNEIEIIIDQALSDWVDGNDEDKGYIGLVSYRLTQAGVSFDVYNKVEED